MRLIATIHRASLVLALKDATSNKFGKKVQAKLLTLKEQHRRPIARVLQVKLYFYLMLIIQLI
jgi:hypothetical protein